MSESFEKAEWMRQSVNAGNPFVARKQDPARHNRINLGWTALMLTMWVGVAALSAVVPWPVYLPLATLFYGWWNFAMVILVLHEASHGIYLLSSDRKWAKKANRVAGWAVAGPLFTEYGEHWEKGHVEHHARPCEPNDPQDADPLTGARLYKMYAKIALIPLSGLLLNPSSKYPGKLRRTAIGLAFWLPVWAALALWVSPFASLALLLSTQVTMLFNWTKKAQEHGAGLAHEPDPILRSRTYFYPGSAVLSPFRINYHFEHHANPYVPWYLLPTYHEALRDVVPKELRNYYFHHEFLAQLQGVKPLPPRELIGAAPQAKPA